MKNFTLLFLCTLYSFLAIGQEWDTPGTTVAGGNGYGGGSNQLQGPTDVKVTSLGVMYITDLSNGRVQKWEPGATQGITVASGLSFPTGLWIEEDGEEVTMYIANGGGHEILEWVEGDDEGTTVAGGNGGGSAANQLFYPTGIFKKDDVLYIVDSGNARVMSWVLEEEEGVVVAGGNGLGFDADQLAMPMLTGYLYVDDDDNVYVTEYSGDRVSKWEPGATEGEVVADIAGEEGGSNVRVSGITFLGDQMLLTYAQTMSSNAYGRKVAIWEDGTYVGDAISTESEELIEPVAITLDANNNMYIVEGSGGGINAVIEFEFVEGSLSVAEQENQLALQLYPNPTSGVLHVANLADGVAKEINVFNTLGQKVYTANNVNTIDVKSVQQGVYTVQIVAAQGKVFTTKIIKE